MKVCPQCGLNPNIWQSKSQQKYEEEYVKEHGMCEACNQEEEGTDLGEDE